VTPAAIGGRTLKQIYFRTSLYAILQDMKKLERPALAIIAVLAWMAIVLQYWVIWQKPAVIGMNAFQITLIFLNYFTLLTNSLVAIGSTISLLIPQSAPGRFFSSTSARSAVAVYILLVGIVFNVLLRAIDIRESFADKLANELTHSVVPILYFLFWLFIVPKGELNWRQPIYWLIYPLIYLPWVFIYGEFTGKYPYPFLHVGNLGYPSVLLNSVGLIVVFLVVGEIFVGIDKLLGRRQKI
jgi:hypothetical protein